MATITPPSSPPSAKSRVDSRDRSARSSSAFEGSGSADELIAARIAEAQAALWRAELIQSILVLVVTGLVVVTAWAMLEQWLWAPGQLVRCIVWLAAVGAAIAWIRYRIWPLFSKQVLPEYAAYSLEHDAPSLRHALTSYVTLRDDQAQAGVRGLVVRSIGARAAGQIRQLQLESPSEAAIRMTWWLALAVAIAFAAAYVALSPRNALQSTTRLLVPLASIDAPHRVTIEDVLPGDTETLASLPFAVSAKIDGLRQSETASVQWGANFSQQQPLDWDAATGRHQANVQVDASTSYRILAGDAVAGPYSISAKSLPVATVEQIEVIPPSYTELPQRTTRGGPIVAEANSTIKLTGTSTLPLRKARIEFNPVEVGDRVQASGGTLDMTISPDRKRFSAEFVLSDRDALSASRRTAYRVHVWDENDHDNPDPIVYPIRMIEDLLPEISIASPKLTEVEVAINGGLPIEIHAADPDYRLKQIDVQIKRSIDVIWSEPVWSSAQGERGHQSLVWMFEPALVRASVGDRFELMAAAMDNHHDAEGQLAPGRTTSSPLIIKIVKADPAGRVGSLGKPEEQGDKQGKSSSKKKDGEQATGSGEGQPSGQSASGGSGEEATPEEQGDGEGGSSGEANKKPGKESGSGEGSSDDQEQQDDQSSSGTSTSKSGKGSSGSNDDKQGDAASDDMPPSSKTDNSGDQKPSDQNSDDQNSGSQGSAQAGNGGKLNQGKPPTAPENADAANGESDDQQGEAADGSMTGEPNAQSGKANGDPSGSNASNSAERPQKPSHDGEAFERIRDFIKNQPPNSKASPGSSAESKPQGDHGSSQEGGSKNKDTTAKPADAATTGSQAGKQGASSPEMKEEQQGAGQDQASNDPPGQSSDPSKGENQESAASKGGEAQSGNDKAQGTESDDGSQDGSPQGEADKGKAEKAEAGDDKDGNPNEAGEPGSGKPTPADSKASRPKQGDSQSPTDGDTQPAGESGEGTDKMDGKSDGNSKDGDQKNGQPTEGENVDGKPKDQSLANEDRPQGDSSKPSNSGATSGVPSRANSAKPDAKDDASQSESPQGPKDKTRTPRSVIATSKRQVEQGRAVTKRGHLIL